MMKVEELFSTDGGLRFLPLAGFVVMAVLFVLYVYYFGVMPLPEAMIFATQANIVIAAQTPRLYFPFAMSSLVLVALMFMMIGIGLVIIYQCAERKVILGIFGATAFIAAALLLVMFGCGFDGMHSLSIGRFPDLDSNINVLLNFSNGLLLVMLLVLALSLSFLPEKALHKDMDKLKQRVRMFKVQIYLASLLMAVGLLEIFLLYYWWFGKSAAQMVVLGNGILYSGLMIVLFLPAALLLHRSALQHQKERPHRKSFKCNQKAESNSVLHKLGQAGEVSMLSPVSGLGHYMAALLPALLGVLPSIIGSA